MVGYAHAVHTVGSPFIASNGPKRLVLLLQRGDPDGPLADS